MTEAAQFENTMSPASSICSTAGTTSDGCGSTLENGFHRRQSLRNGKDAMKSVASVESSESATTLHHVRNMIRQAARRHVECRCKCAVENKRLSSLVEKLQVVLKRQKEELIAMQRNVDERLGTKGTSVRHAQLQVNFDVAQQQAEASSKTTTTTTLISICSNDLEQNSQYPPILDREVMTKETITPAESLNDRLTIPPEPAPPKRQKAVKTMRCKPQAAAVPQAPCTTQQKPAPAPPAPVQNVNPVVQSRRLSEVHDASNGASVSAPTSYLYNNDRLSFPSSIHASTMMPMGNTEPLNGVSYRIRSPATRPSLPANAINGLAKEFVTFVSHSPPTVAGGCLGSAKRKTDPMAPLHEVPLSKLSRSANSSSPYMPNSLVLEADDIITLDDDEDDDDGDGDDDDDEDEDDKDNNRWSSNVVVAMSALQLIRTIEDDEPIADADESSDSDDEAVTTRKKKARKPIKGASDEFANDFRFAVDDETPIWQDSYNRLKQLAKQGTATSLDEKIALVRKRRKAEGSDLPVENGLAQDSVSSTSGYVSDEVDDHPDQERVETADSLRAKQKTTKKRRLEEAAFFEAAPAVVDSDGFTFQEMNLSRPLLKAITASGFLNPTPVQAACIPVALLGKDICACAATGTGKTAAFMLPILERLLYKPKQKAVTRVLVLVPTRELAIQVFQVSRKLSQFTNIDISLSAGGLDLKAQEAALRLGPDIVIATPGRLIDHLHNAPNFNLHSIEVLVLDEADRMLDDNFAEQMKEVIRLCSRTRQTMLFSATMTDQVNELATMSLNKPVKLFINENTDVAFNLRQEFIRVRPNREGDREAIVAALVTRTFLDHTMLFVQTKKQCHRLHIVLGLLGIRVGELHGNLSQAQRMDALARFKNEEIDVLCSTDLAARGLDIEGVKTVINFTMPISVKHYVHRVGRTARAGKAGRSISLVGEQERKVLKEIVRNARAPLKQRLIAQEVIEAYTSKIASYEEDIKRIIEEEAVEKEIRIAEKQMNTATHKIEEGQTERDGRVWFQTMKEKRAEKVSLRLANPGDKKTKKGKEKISKPRTPEERVNFDLQKIADFQVRAAKRDRKPKRMRAVVEDDDNKRKPQKRRNGSKRAGDSNGTPKRKSSAFTSELTSVSKKSIKQFRHGPSDPDFKKAKIDKRKAQQKKR